MSAPSDCPHTRINLKTYAVIPVWYGCNNSCSICMLSRVKGRLSTVDFDTYSALVAALASDDRFDSLILSGAEVTTFPLLEKYVRYAATLRHFRKIQLQTNGRRLADKRYLEGLVAAGVNEFFISIHGPEAVHDAITGIPGSYAAAREGLRNLAEFPVTIITNSVLTRFNYHSITSLLGELSAAPVSEMHLWNFFPMAKTDHRDLVVSLRDLAALFPGIRSALESSGKSLVLKGFPECLSPSPPIFITSDFPLNLIQDDFWVEFAQNGFGTCVYKNRCRAGECWGLSSAYIEKFGDEMAVLVPLMAGGTVPVTGVY